MEMGQDCFFCALSSKTLCLKGEEVYVCTIAPKLLYGRKECELGDLLTPLATHTLLYSRK